MFIIPLTPDEAIQRWEIIADILRPAMVFEDGKYTLDDIKKSVGESTSHVWVAAQDANICGAAITQICHYPQKSMLLVVCLAGKEFHLWDNIVQEHFIPYAKRASCMGIEFLGRPGWVKRAARLGFKPVHYVYELAIKEDDI